ncbi:PREDICTED: uncharacterized protein LOC109473406 [Branchiostoma belcheri]|uniref:Uncharacterized protein LOC109473406 n=1 Tax=Branchiostoma belcheri TaxID=7741 RepID=A0A6P4YHN7_BRABE|nr:PREDICTED: uncharacterized protein LOC109473406 [Branchiostoma belcheri]
MDRERTGRTMNRTEVRGSGNIVITAGDNAVITIPPQGHEYPAPAGSSDADTEDREASFTYEDHSGTGNENRGGYDQDPSSAHPRQPQAQSPASPASSPDSRTQDLLDECVSTLLEMGISTELSAPIVRELISITDNRQRDRDLIVDRTLQRLEENRPEAVPEAVPEAAGYQTNFGKDGIFIYKNTAPVVIGSHISGAGPLNLEDTPDSDHKRFQKRRDKTGRRQETASAARQRPNSKQRQPEQDAYLNNTTCAEIASSQRNRELMENLPPKTAARQIARETQQSDEQHFPPISDDETSSSEESEALSDTDGEAPKEDEKEDTEGDSGRYTQQGTSRPTFDDVDGQLSAEEDNQATDGEPRRRGPEDDSGREVSQQHDEESITPEKAPLYVALPEEKSPAELSTTEKQQWSTPQNPPGGSLHTPDHSGGSPQSMDSLRVQSGYKQDNEASNWPVVELPRSADEEDVTVRPLVELYPHPGINDTIMDDSIPSLEQQPLTPQPAAPQQQDGNEGLADPRENQPPAVLTSGEERPQPRSMEAQDTSDAETEPKGLLDKTNTDEGVRGAAGKEDHQNVTQQVTGSDDTGGNQPEYDKERGLYTLTLAHIKQMTEDFSETKKIADGAFGPVYQSVFPYDGPLKGRKVAVKVNRSADQGQREFMQELKMAGSRHPHLLPLFGICEDERCLSLVSPYMANKDLKSWIQDKTSPTDWKTRLVIGLDLISAIRYYHQKTEGPKKRFHCDVKSANVFLDAQLRARLGDPGLMREVSEDKTDLTITVSKAGRGTSFYQDPYFSKYCKYHETSDIYSAGKVFLELFTSKTADSKEDGRLLFEIWSEEKEYFSALSDGTELCEVADRSDAVAWPECSEDGSSATQQFAKLIIRCLQDSPKKRITLEELYKELKSLVTSENALRSFGTEKPDFCTCCLRIKPSSIPMSCGCVSVCVACMKKNSRALYCTNHHTETTGLGQNTFAVLVGMKGRKRGEQGFGKDAEEMYRVLTDPNICAVRPENVKLLTNGEGTSENIKKAVKELGQEMNKVPESQQKCLLYYHSGHGENPRKSLKRFLVCEDKRNSSSQMRKLFAELCPTRSLYILDVCFASSVQLQYMNKEDEEPVAVNTDQVNEGGLLKLIWGFLPAWLTSLLPVWMAPEQEEGEEEQEGEEEDEENFLKSCIPQGSLLWASSRSNETSQVEKSATAEDKISVFTKYILAGLCGGDKSLKDKTQGLGGMPLNFLQDYVFDEVKKEVGDQQTPSISGQDEKTYWIAYPPED